MTDYHLVTNSVAPSQVRETDDAYVIEDVPFVRPMDLAGGYVPAESIADTIDQWAGVPVTMNHPRNARGEPIAANRKPETHLGIVENPRWDGDTATANVVVRKSRLEAVDGADAVHEALEAEQPVDVSSQYAASDLPAGEYDGAMRENVEAITRPDSLALLPNKRGRCSIADGCGIDPELVANAEVHLPMTQNAEDGEDMDAAAADYTPVDVSPEDIDEWTDTEWDGSAAVAAMPNPSETEDAPGVLDQTHAAIPTRDEAREVKGNWKLPFRTAPGAPVNTRALVAIDAALAGGRGGVDGVGEDTAASISAWVQEMLAAAPDDLFGAGGGQSANALERLGRQVASALGLTAGGDSQSGDPGGDEPAESGVDSTQTMDRNTLIEEITANSALTEAALSERCDDGLEAIHDDIMSNTDNDDGQTATDNTDNDTEEYVTSEDLEDFRESLVDEVAEQVSANASDSRKADLAGEIVANSAEYDDADAVREDYPTEAALETKRDQVTENTTMPTAGGLKANVGESNDDGIEVSSGLLGGDD